MKKTNCTLNSGLVLLALASLLPKVSGADAPATAPLTTDWQKPVWLTDLSLGVKETYDDNIFGVSGDGAMAKQSSWVTTISPKFGFNFAPLLGNQSLFQVVSFVYAPDFALYHNDQTESYDAQRIGNTIKGADGNFSYNLDNSFTFIDGSSVAPIYTTPDDNWRSGFGAAMPLARSKQIQERAKVSLRYDWENWFLRPTASLLCYDMMTDLRSTPGYQNYPSRGDVNGGADGGYKLTKDFALTLGYRYGYQYQDALPSNIDPHRFSSANHYQRILLGFEGKPWNWLTVAFQAGPDFRTYGDSAPVQDTTAQTYYGEGSLTADVTANDSFTLKYKQWQFVAFTGKVPCYDSSGELNYHRKVTKDLSFDLGGRMGCVDFNEGYGADLKNTNKKKDYLYAVTAGVNYAFTTHLTGTVSYTLNMGRNGEDDLAVIKQNPEYREFNENLVSVGMLYKF